MFEATFVFLSLACSIGTLAYTLLNMRQLSGIAKNLRIEVKSKTFDLEHSLKSTPSRSVAINYREENLDILTSKIHGMVNYRFKHYCTPLEDDDEISPTAAQIGIGNIEILLSMILEVSPELSLFCINKGGALIATYLAHKMNLDQKYLVKCDYNKKTEKIYCETRDELKMPIILIDDVARTGDTLSKTKKFIKLQYPDTPVYCFVLVASADCVEGLVDFTPWITGNKNITFQWSPWTGFDQNTENSNFHTLSKEEIQKFFDDAYEASKTYIKQRDNKQIFGRLNYLAGNKS